MIYSKYIVVIYFGRYYAWHGLRHYYRSDTWHVAWGVAQFTGVMHDTWLLLERLLLEWHIMPLEWQRNLQGHLDQGFSMAFCCCAQLFESKEVVGGGHGLVLNWSRICSQCCSSLSKSAQVKYGVSFNQFWPYEAENWIIWQTAMLKSLPA